MAMDSSPFTKLLKKASGTDQGSEPVERVIIWNGVLEWHGTQTGQPEGHKAPIQCLVSTNFVNKMPEVNGIGWPSKLILQLLPKSAIRTVGVEYFSDAKTVMIDLKNSDALSSLTQAMDSGLAGCVHFIKTEQSPCSIKLLILLYSRERNAFLGFIPTDQVGFVSGMRKLILEEKARLVACAQEQCIPKKQPMEPQEIKAKRSPAKKSSSRIKRNSSKRVGRGIWDNLKQPSQELLPTTTDEKLDFIIEMANRKDAKFDRFGNQLRSLVDLTTECESKIKKLEDEVNKLESFFGKR